MPGVVSEFIIRLITRQVAERCLVVWYDPERAYESLAPTLATRFASSTENGTLNTANPPQITLYTGSFLDLENKSTPFSTPCNPRNWSSMSPSNEQKLTAP